VRALASCRRARHVGVEHPAAGEDAVTPVPSCNDYPCVTTARENRAGPVAVEVGHAAEKAVDPVAVGVAPIADGAARGQVVRGLHRRAGLAVEYGDELRAAENTAVGIAVIDRGRTDHHAGPVHRAVRGLGHDLGLAVAIEIIGHHRRVVGTGTNVLAQVDPPHASPVELVSIEQDVASLAGLRIVLGIRRLPTIIS
jgi:hypothetical protein